MSSNIIKFNGLKLLKGGTIQAIVKTDKHINDSIVVMQLKYYKVVKNTLIESYVESPLKFIINKSYEMKFKNKSKHIIYLNSMEFIILKNTKKLKKKDINLKIKSIKINNEIGDINGKNI